MAGACVGIACSGAIGERHRAVRAPRRSAVGVRLRNAARARRVIRGIAGGNEAGAGGAVATAGSVRHRRRAIGRPRHAAVRVVLGHAARAVRVEAHVASDPTARPIAGGAAVRRRRACRAIRPAAVDARIGEAAVCAEVRARGAGGADVPRAILACAVARRCAAHAVCAGLALRGAETAAVQPRFVLVLDGVDTGVGDARAAARMEPAVAGDEHAGSGAAASHAVRIERRTVHAAGTATGALGGDADAARRDVARVAPRERARARGGTGASTVAECRRAVGARRAAAAVRIGGAGGGAFVKASCAGEDADVAAARGHSVRHRGAIGGADAASSRSAFVGAAAAAVHRGLVTVLDQVGAGGGARIVRTQSTDAVAAAAARRAEAALRRTAPAAVDVCLVAVPNAVRARARRACPGDADPAGAIRRPRACDAVRTSPRTRATAVDAGLAAIEYVVAARRLLADAVDARQGARARIVRVVADRVR